MWLSEFWQAVEDEFGAAYGRLLVEDQVLVALGDRSARSALDAGVPPKDVWLALCAASGVPEDRWYGVGQRPPRD